MTVSNLQGRKTPTTLSGKKHHLPFKESRSRIKVAMPNGLRRGPILEAAGAAQPVILAVKKPCGLGLIADFYAARV
jgi:hypothetical protein